MAPSFWQEALYELQQQRPLPPRAPHIPQAPLAPTVDDLLAEVGDEMRGPTPAASVQERFGVRPGGDIGIAPRRGFATDATPEPSLLDLTPGARARLVRKATERGMLGPESERAQEAHDRAALVDELTKSGTWRTAENNTPGRKVNSQGVAGHTIGQGYER